MSDTLTIFGIDYPDAVGFKAKDDGGTTHTYTEGGGFTITDESNSTGTTAVITAGGGGGSSVQTATGTFTGSGTTQAQISCNFAPDLIYVYGDLTNDVSLRGVSSIVIIKDTAMYTVVDGSTSSYQPSLFAIDNNITGYNEANSSTEPHGTYSNGTLTLDTVENTTSARFNSSITYNYKLVKWS